LCTEFHITGTVGAALARKGAASEYLNSPTSSAEDRSANEPAASDIRSSPGLTSDLSPVRTAFDELSQMLGTNSDDEYHDEYHDEAGDIDAGQNNSLIISVAQDDSEGGQNDAPNGGTTQDDTDPEVQIASNLWKSWFGRTRSTDAMTKGTKSQVAISRSLSHQRWVKHVWDVGLVAMKSAPWIAVSADGMVEVYPPHSTSNPVVATLEIKTKVAPHLVAAAKTVKQQYGHYFQTSVGTSAWFKAVPHEYRGQVIHQVRQWFIDFRLYVSPS